MACCGEYNDQDTLQNQSIYAYACLTDLTQQICITIAERMAKAIEDGTIPLAFKGQATALQNYVAQNTEACIDALKMDSDPDYNELSSTWNIPNNAAWSSIDDPYIQIVSSSISDVYLPQSPEQCTDLSWNNGTFFNEAVSPIGTTIAIAMDDGDGDLNGPSYGYGNVASSADFASDMTSCNEPFCSKASFSVNGSAWALDSMVMFTDGAITVSDRSGAETVTDVRIELHGQALGTISSGDHEIATGDAFFVVSGNSSDEWGMLNLTNSSEIVMSEVTSGEWAIESFDISYEDSNSDTWTLTVNSTSWVE